MIDPYRSRRQLKNAVGRNGPTNRAPVRDNGQVVPGLRVRLNVGAPFPHERSRHAVSPAPEVRRPPSRRRRRSQRGRRFLRVPRETPRRRTPPLSLGRGRGVRGGLRRLRAHILPQGLVRHAIAVADRAAARRADDGLVRFVLCPVIAHRHASRRPPPASGRVRRSVGRAEGGRRRDRARAQCRPRRAPSDQSRPPPLRSCASSCSSCSCSPPSSPRRPSSTADRLAQAADAGLVHRDDRPGTDSHSARTHCRFSRS